MAMQQPGVRGLYIAFELGWEKWVLAFATELAEKPRYRTLVARDPNALMAEIAKAKERFKLPADAPVFTCYEAGRDGFWLHRFLTAKGIANLVVDPASIEVNWRAKQAKNDSLDAAKLLNQLIRYHHGEKKVWKVVNPPSLEDEDRRQTHRGLKDLQHQRTECGNRIKGLLASLGLAATVDAEFRKTLDTLRDWQGKPVPAGMRERLLQEFAVWEVIHRQIMDIENARKRELRAGKSPWLDKVRRLMGLKAIGIHSAWVFVLEIFGWRQIRNGKQLAALVGLTPTPYASGTSEREQGISKAGKRHVRVMLIEIAWAWLGFQPKSRLSQWYQERFGKGNTRARKIGIVALARKLLIALWKYVEGGAVPEGAEEKDWELLVSDKGRRKSQAAAAVA